jgi:hypothetical protein
MRRLPLPFTPPQIETRAELVMFALVNGVIGPDAD